MSEAHAKSRVLSMAPVSAEVASQLHRRIPTYVVLQSMTRQPAISIGVLHNGYKIFTYNHGRKDVNNTDSTPDEDTLYCIASLTKQLIAGTISTLVDDAKLSWDTRLSTILPGFANMSDQLLGERATVKDILSHRSGLNGLDVLVQGINGEVTLGKDEIQGFANALPASNGLRSKFAYCNMGYSLAGEVIEQVSGQTWTEALTERILMPLQMSRTFCHSSIHETDDNIAKPYNILTDGTAVDVPVPVLDGDHINGAAGGIRSSVNDLLRWSKALMSNTLSPYIVESDHPGGTSNDSYLNVTVPKIASFAEILKAAIIVDAAAPSEHNYGMGLMRQTTPAVMGSISPNRKFANPVMGDEAPPMKVFSHHGDFDGSTCSLYMFPRTTSAVVVLSNAKGLSDATDWIAQDIIQTIFDVPPYIDILQEAQSCKTGYNAWFNEKIKDPLAARRRAYLGPRPREDFIGEYQLSGYKNFSLIVKAHEIEEEKMVMLVNEKQSQRHVLSHYHFDVWEFAPASYDDFIRDGYGCYEAAEEFLLSFQRQSNGDVTSLKWRINGDDVLFTRLVR